MRDYAKLNLKGNPFEYITPTPGQSHEDYKEWAGLPDLKGKLTAIYINAVSSPARQVVLNWGPYGGGKTFSAYYFIEKHRVNRTDKIQIYQAYIRCPKEGPIATRELFSNILDYMSFSQIRVQVKLLIDKIGKDNLVQLLNRRIRSEEFSSAIVALGSDDNEKVNLMHRYLYDGLTKTELKQVNLPRNISSNTEYVKFLSGIITCFIGDQANHDGRFILWIDEMEDLIYYSQRYYRAFSQVLRDLIDTLNEYFTVFLNFTLAEPEEGTIEMLLGGALWSRINKKLRFREMSLEDVLLYCEELIENFQIDKTTRLFPFSEEAIKTVYEIIPNELVTPRDVNSICGEILAHTLDVGAESVTSDLISRWANIAGD